MQILKCHDRYALGERRGLSLRTCVVDERGLPCLSYRFMYETIDDAMDAEVLQAWLVAIQDLETGRVEQVEKSTEAWVFQMSPKSVTFESEFGQGSGGKVTLEQFKLAVSTFRDFLNDPERKPVGIPFPDE